MSQIDSGFRGYAGEPQSELDVAFLAGLLYDHLPFPLVVKSINDAYPDCEGIDPLTGKPVRIELEVYSRNYLSHGHPMTGCDYILCWRDNWPESPIPVVAIEDIIEANGLEGSRFLYIPREGSLRLQLDELQKTDPTVFDAVKYFLADVVPSVLQKHKGSQLDDTTSKHFTVRDGIGRGFFGVYPYGKLICISVKEAVRRYGEEIAPPTNSFRDQVIATKMLRSKEQGDRIGQALDKFLASISRTQT